MSEVHGSTIFCCFMQRRPTGRQEPTTKEVMCKVYYCTIDRWERESRLCNLKYSVIKLNRMLTHFMRKCDQNNYSTYKEHAILWFTPLYYYYYYRILYV